jgi:hypothetical protein
MLPRRVEEEPRRRVIAKGSVGEELAEEVLPKRRWVELEVEAEEQKGQWSTRDSQPSRRSFWGQLERSLVGSQGRMSWYQRWEQGEVVRLRLATHMLGQGGVLFSQVWLISFLVVGLWSWKNWERRRMV